MEKERVWWTVWVFSLGTKILSQYLSCQTLFITLYYLHLSDKEVLWLGCEMSHRLLSFYIWTPHGGDDWGECGSLRRGLAAEVGHWDGMGYFTDCSLALVLPKASGVRGTRLTFLPPCTHLLVLPCHPCHDGLYPPKLWHTRKLFCLKLSFIRCLICTLSNNIYWSQDTSQWCLRICNSIPS